MREERIIAHPFEELRIEEYSGLQQINEHACARLAGLIPFDKKDEYMKLGASRTWVRTAAVMQEEESILLYGVIENMRLEVKGGTCRMELTLRSGTALMDSRRRTRSFQNTQASYSEILDICGQGYKDAGKIMTAAKEEKTNQFIMQYQETDWEFIKRLASTKHTVVVADASTGGEKYYFGLPDRENTINGDSAEYSICCDMEEYGHRRACGLDIAPRDAASYVWESRDIYALGDCGTIAGRQLFIWKIETRMKGNILYHTYYMRPKLGFQMPVQYNAGLAGASLFGTVQGVSGEKVKIEISEDENKDRAGAYEFAYATPYSSDDGTGWYCMPEIGDKIRIFFPTQKEQDAYVVSAYHENGAQLRTKPERKFWRNKEGKEIQLAPGRILLTNNDGTYVELSDQSGVEIVSAGSVTLSAGGMLRISSANSSIELSAPDKIKLKQGETEMNLGGDLNLSGAQIKL